MSPDAGQSRIPSAVPPRAAEGHSLSGTTEAATQATPATLDAFLADISARAFRFAELGLRHREDALDAVQDAMMKMMGDMRTMADACQRMMQGAAQQAGKDTGRPDNPPAKTDGQQ